MYDLVKVFDLSIAPPDLRESDDLAPLRPASDEDETAILTLTVGNYLDGGESRINACITREVTLTEFLLHRWLTEQGAREGEDVLLRWKARNNT
jgi:hypothetical protein